MPKKPSTSKKKKQGIMTKIDTYVKKKRKKKQTKSKSVAGARS